MTCDSAHSWWLSAAHWKIRPLEPWPDIPHSHIILTLSQHLPYPINIERHATKRQVSIWKLIGLNRPGTELTHEAHPLPIRLSMLVPASGIPQVTYLQCWWQRHAWQHCWHTAWSRTEWWSQCRGVTTPSPSRPRTSTQCTLATSRNRKSLFTTERLSFVSSVWFNHTHVIRSLYGFPKRIIFQSSNQCYIKLKFIFIENTLFRQIGNWNLYLESDLHMCVYVYM